MSDSSDVSIHFNPATRPSQDLAQWRFTNGSQRPEPTSARYYNLFNNILLRQWSRTAAGCARQILAKAEENPPAWLPCVSPG